jgi:chemotaxis regulatin CheY-phosphate phosphatase CheZ
VEDSVSETEEVQEETVTAEENDPFDTLEEFPEEKSFDDEPDEELLKEIDSLSLQEEDKTEEAVVEPQEEEKPVEEILPENETEEDPISELKASAPVGDFGEDESFDKLKTLSKKIIDGEAVDLGINIKSEVSELLKLIMETKDRVDEIEPTLITSKEQLPNVVKSLENVTESTEEATLTLMESADGLTSHYQDFIGELEDLEDLIYKKDKAAILKKITKLEEEISHADSSGLNILHALEFQDITEQKLNKVIDAIREVGGRIGAILGFIKLKQQEDPTVVDDASQDDIDKLLADFGLD